MQERVTWKNRGRFKKNLICFIAFSLAIVILFCVFVDIFKKKKPTAFDEHEYYFVYSEKNKKQAILEASVDKIKSLGGAGEIYFYQDYYYLICSVYQTSSDAEEIKNNVVKNFSGAGILTLKASKLKKNLAREIKQNEKLFSLFNFVYKTSMSYVDYAIRFMAGTIEQGKLSMQILNDKLKLDETIGDFKPNSELSNQIFGYLNMIKLYYDNFFSKFFESNKKESLLSSLAVNFCLLRILMCNNL